jgi:meiotically up-regulated gene 157 (Mug157) protein
MQLTQEQVLTNLKNNYESCSLASRIFWVNSLWTEETVAELQFVGKVLWKLTKAFLLVALILLTALLFYPTKVVIKMWNLLTQAVNPISTILNVLEVSSDQFTHTEYTFDSTIVKEVETQQKDSPKTVSGIIKSTFLPIDSTATSRLKSFFRAPVNKEAVESNNQDTDKPSV